MKHSAIFIPDTESKTKLLDNISDGVYPQLLKDWKHKKIAIFSSYTLLKYLEEEHIRDRIDMISIGERPLATYSEGEQKKKLFYYLLSQEPECLIIDNVLDNLDILV